MKKLFVALEKGDKVYGAYHDANGYYIAEGTVVSNQIEEREIHRGPAWDSVTIKCKEHVLRVSFDGIDEVYEKCYENDDSDEKGIGMHPRYSWTKQIENPRFQVFIGRKPAVDYNIQWAKTLLDTSNERLNKAIAEVEESKRMLETALAL